LLVLALSTVYAFWAQIYPRDLGTVPALVAETTIGFALLDVIAQTDTKLGRIIRRIAGQSAAPGEAEAHKPAARTITLSIVWPLAYVAAVIVFGFLISTPVYIWLYMWLFGRKPLLSSLVSAGISTLLIWVTFEVLFRYPLYQGLLFGGSL